MRQQSEACIVHITTNSVGFGTHISVYNVSNVYIQV